MAEFVGAAHAFDAAAADVESTFETVAAELTYVMVEVEEAVVVAPHDCIVVAAAAVASVFEIVPAAVLAAAMPSSTVLLPSQTEMDHSPRSPVGVDFENSLPAGLWYIPTHISAAEEEEAAS